MEPNEIQELKAQLEALQSRISQLEVDDEPARSNRRGMLKLAAGAAAGAVAGGLAFGARPASAAGLLTDKVEKGIDNPVIAPTVISGAAFTSSGGRGILHITDDNSVTDGTASGSALSILSSGNKTTIGLAAKGSATGAKLDGPVPLKLSDVTDASATLPTTGYKGQFRVYNGNLYFCVDHTGLLGQNAKWRRITGPTAAGAFHAISPVRVYDSRQSWATPNGVLAPNTNVTVSVATAYANDGTPTNNVVPAGATAVAYNATVSGATGGNYLAITPGDSTSFTASALNFVAGVDVANASVVKLDSSRQIKVFCGNQSGSTHVLIDIVGYYL